jgi:hypothetical protein
VTAPQPSDLTNLLYGATSGQTVDSGQGAEALSIVSQLANAHTRGVGFTNGVPNADIAAVIKTAAARLIANPSQLLTDETVGQESASFRSAWTGWTVPELFALNRYRVRAQ